MAVYVDAAIFSKYGKRWCHMMSDDLESLHALAARLGISRNRFQLKVAPHYDLTEDMRTQAISLGAIPCHRREIVRLIRHYRPLMPQLIAAKAQE